MKSEYSILSYDIWFDDDARDRMVQHGGSPRLKYGRDTRWYPFSIEEHPKLLVKPGPKLDKALKFFSSSDIDEITDYISKRWRIMMRWWRKEMSAKELMRKLEKIDSKVYRTKKQKKGHYFTDGPRDDDSIIDLMLDE